MDTTSTKKNTFSSLFTKDVVLATGLFAALSPGVLLTIPPESRGLLFSGQTTPRSVLTHAAIFGATYIFLKKAFGIQHQTLYLQEASL